MSERILWRRAYFCYEVGSLLFKKASCLARRFESFVCWIGTAGLVAAEGISEVVEAIIEEALEANLVRLDVFAITKVSLCSLLATVTKIPDLPYPRIPAAKPHQPNKFTDSRNASGSPSTPSPATHIGRQDITMAVEKGDQLVSIKHPSGATVKILKYGATVISWKNSNGQEHLFLSE